MKKIFRLLDIMIISMFVLIGCGSNNDEIMTAKEFKTIMEEKGFSVVDQTETATDSSYQQIYVAIDDEKYSFEYYFMKDPNSAAVVYDYAVDNLEAAYSDNKKAKMKETGSGSNLYYSVSADDYYCEVIQKENTVLYVTAYAEQKEDTISIIKELGY